MGRKLLTIKERHSGSPEVKEIDFNPILAYNNGALAVDAKVILEESSSRRS